SAEFGGDFFGKVWLGKKAFGDIFGFSKNFTHSVCSPATGESGWKQRQRWLCSPNVSAGSERQASFAKSQRVRNAQPSGRLSGWGAAPRIWVSRAPRSLAAGAEPISPAV